MATTATRLLNLIMLLQREPNKSASRLAQDLDVSVRTVQRYIGMLEDMGVPVYAERGMRGGYSLVRGYRMPPLIFSPEEAVAMYLGTTLVESVWGKLFRGSAQSAMTKIENVLPHDQLREIGWARDSLITRGLPRTHPGMDENQLEALYQASRQQRRVIIHYRGRQQTETQVREIEPYALVYSWGQQYCIAFCRLRNAVRSFRVDRIEKLDVQESLFDKPADFNPARHLAESGDERPLQQVLLQFEPEHAVTARDYSCCWDTLAEQPDGSVIAGFMSADLDGAVCRIMGFLPKARVLAPTALADKVQAAARAIVAQYQSEAPALPSLTIVKKNNKELAYE